MEDTTLAVRESRPAAMVQYGDRESLELLGNRIAMFFGVGDTKTGAARDEELKLARPACLKAAQLTYQYGLVPGMDVYVIKRGKAYSAEPSLQMWQKMADRHAFIGKFRFVVDTEDLTPAEVAEHTDPDVKASPEDRGARARVLRLDLAKEMKDLGLPYRPTWHYGFWRKNAREETIWDDASRTKVKTGNYEADQVPAQRTRQDVATRRATRAALMAAFPMIPVDDFEQRYQSTERAAEIRLAQAMRFIDGELAERARVERDADDPTVNAGFVEKYVKYEENGDVLWAADAPRKAETVIDVTPTVLPPEPPAQNGNGRPTNGNGGNAVRWDNAAAAYAWAVESGACSNEFEAKNSMRKIVDGQFGGRLTKDNMTAVFEAFHARQMDKLHELANSAVEDAPVFDPDAEAVPA